jgi:hypothetical protein
MGRLEQPDDPRPGGPGKADAVPWHEGLATLAQYAFGTPEMQADAWAFALGLPSDYEVGDATVEAFILGDQWKHLH